MNLRLLAMLIASGMAGAAQAAEPEAAPKWQASVSAGASLSGGADDQYNGGLAVTRDFGDSYVQLGLSYTDAGRSIGVINEVPAKAWAATLAAGSRFGDLSLDGYATLGRRRFKDELIGPGGARARVSARGRSNGVGATLTYDVALGEANFLSPYLGVDYHAVDVARVATTAGGAQSVVEQRQDGVSGSVGFAFQHLFGADRKHSIGPYAGIVISSDNTAYAPGPGGDGLAGMLSVRGGGIRDEWAEVGASASFAFGGTVRLKLSAAQTIGFQGPEITSLSTGVSLRF